VGPAELVRRDGTRPLVVVDLGLPRNVDPSVGAHPEIRLIDLGQLGRGRRSSVDPASAQSIDRAASEAYARFRRASLEPFVAELWRAAERVRVAEVERAAPYLASLAPPERASVEKLTERLVRRLLSVPTERLRELSVEEEEATVRELAIRLFAPSARVP
jgi:glutamyl-tRNA reductase